MNRLVVPSALLIISLILVSGCTQVDTSGTGQITAKDTDKPEGWSIERPKESIPPVPEPVNINLFDGVKEGDLIRFYIVFNDRIGHDGKVSLKITDDTDKTVYASQFDVKASQFVDYQFQLTGESIGKAYEWNVPYSSIQKGTSSMGKAYLTFTTPSGKNLNADTTIFDLPSYTREEIEQLYENQYLQTAKTIDQTMSEGDFEVTLVKVGYYGYLDYDQELNYFRADIKVKNIGSESKSFSSYDAAMIIGSNQYSRSYRSEFEGINIYPGVIKEGYLLFEDVPENIGGEVKIIAGGAYWHSVDYHSWRDILYTFTIHV